jgi:hypothetical protein
MALRTLEATKPATVTLAAKVPSRPLTETQLLRRRATYTWLTMPEQSKPAWTTFSAKFRRYSPAKGKVIAPTPRALFIKLTLERWRLDPGLPTPTEPPADTFSGDNIGVFAIQASKNNPVPPGHIRIAATGPNRQGVMTALLLQKLSGPNRKPSPRYLRAADFVTFTADQTFRDLKAEPGHYAAAYRFVDEESLQLSPVMEAGTIPVDIKPRRKKAKPTPEAAPITHAIIDTERFATLHHWPA